MTLIKNNFGTVDLQATAADFEKRITALETGEVSAATESELAARVTALEALVTNDVQVKAQVEATQTQFNATTTSKLTEHDSRLTMLEDEISLLRAALEPKEPKEPNAPPQA